MPPEILLAAFLLTASVGILLSACSAKQHIAYQELHRALATDDPPRSVAVLPFSDRSRTEELAEMVRTSFYSHLSALPYKDIELYEVDARLKKHDLNFPDRTTPSAVKEIGRALAADAIVIGEVTEFERVFVGFYSQLSVGAAITIYDTRSGHKLWNDEYVSRFHEGGLPLDLISIPLITMRSGFNLRDTVKLRAVDELCRQLIERIPSPRNRPADGDRAPAYAYEVQSGSYLDQQLAIEHLNNLRQRGFAAFIRQHQTSSDLWHRVLLGPYQDHAEALLVQERVRAEVNTNAYICRVPFKPEARPE